MKTKVTFRQVIVFILAVLWLCIAGAPFFFMVQTGFKQQSELLSGPVWALPKVPTLSNYVGVLTGKFFIFFRNSVVVVAGSVILILLVSAMSSYVFSRIKFKLNTAIFGIIIAGMAIPVHVTLIPVYLLTNKLGLYDTLLALIGPYVALNIPMSIFILTEFMRDIPRELEESARIDGCGPKGIFFRIILPLSRPGLVTLAIYNAVFLWNEFIFVLVLTQSTNNRTLPLGIWEYQGQYAANIPMIMALLTLASLPMMIAYLVGQEKLIKGMMAGAIKG
ncbi:carbohydrate ABC transporter permease [Petroclostridium xylanilyticum]|uniref:carbohydrate ABC transporter permease n=1 Tax=Petroclostridium xylanilyticum TaxID=1792311 RepID=UPI000B99302B|nr:carbohydrate ABC transporter permease [Petroclostridium xylanilyticum]